MDEFKDKTIQCVDCGEEFLFTANEQRFYQEKGFTHEPKRCKSCREKKKQERANLENKNEENKHK